MQRPVPSWLPFGDGEALPGYQYIKGAFRISTILYYNGLHCSGTEHVPPAGSPALLCFNHSNGLVDAMMVLRSCPRMVRFMAKDTLWKIPFIGCLVSAAGAVPVQRREEHGADADTTASLAAVLEALRQGCLVGIAPEGNSRMRTMLDAPLKKGVGHLAVEAALSRFEAAAAQPEGRGAEGHCAVHLVPCGLSYPHRERWRSEAMVAYGEPIAVDAAFLRRFGLLGLGAAEAKQTQQYRAAVNEVMERLAAALASLSPLLPPPARPADEAQALEGDWQALAAGVTAGRVLRPGGTEVPLPEWLGVVRHCAAELASERHEVLARSVRDYQRTLDATGLSDAQVLAGRGAGCCGSLAVILGRALLGMVLLALSLPGLVPWLPILFFCLLKERRILKQGLLPSQPGRGAAAGAELPLPGPVRRRRNFDTLAEGKMLIGAMFSFVLRIGCCLALYLRGHYLCTGLLTGFVVLPLVMWLSVRFLEEGLANFRAAHAIWVLLAVPSAKLEALAKRRCELATALALLPGKAEPLGAVPANWSARRFFTPWRRWKADWHESLLIREDLSFLGVHEGAGPAAPDQGPAAPLLPG